MGGTDDAVKYFLYISDAKVDMLFGQVPQKILKRIAAELTIDLKVVSLLFEPEGKWASPTGSDRSGEPLPSLPEPRQASWIVRLPGSGSFEPRLTPQVRY